MNEDWTDYDEGYVKAQEWARALDGGAELPVEETDVPLEPGEIAHLHVGPVTIAAYVIGGYTYQPMFGIIVTGQVALGRRAAWRANANQGGSPRWQRLAVADVVVTNRRLIACEGEKIGSVSYGEAGPLRLIAGMDGGPAVQFRPVNHPSIQLASPWAPVLYVFAHQLTDGHPPAVPLPPAVHERARAAGRLA